MSRSFEEVCIDLELAESEINRLKGELEDSKRYGTAKFIECSEWIEKVQDLERQLAEANDKIFRLMRVEQMDKQIVEQAHRQGWEQAKKEAFEIARTTQIGYIQTTIAAMEYKEKVND